jgi:hypothetical protein
MLNGFNKDLMLCNKRIIVGAVVLKMEDRNQDFNLKTEAVKLSPKLEVWPSVDSLQSHDHQHGSGCEGEAH